MDELPDNSQFFDEEDEDLDLEEDFIGDEDDDLDWETEEDLIEEQILLTANSPRIKDLGDEDTSDRKGKTEQDRIISKAKKSFEQEQIHQLYRSPQSGPYEV